MGTVEGPLCLLHSVRAVSSLPEMPGGGAPSHPAPACPARGCVPPPFPRRRINLSACRGLRCPLLCAQLWGDTAVRRTWLTRRREDGPGRGVGGRRCCALPAAGATRWLTWWLRLRRSARGNLCCLAWSPPSRSVCALHGVEARDRKPVDVRPGASNVRRGVRRPPWVGAGCSVAG